MATNTAKVAPAGSRLSRFWNSLLRVTIYASGVMILILMVMVAFSVIMRYVFKTPTGWVPDFAGYLQYALILIGAAWVLKIKRHVRIDVLVAKYSRRTQTIIEIITMSMAFIAYAIFFYVGLKATITAFINGDVLYKELIMPLGPLYAFIPFGLGLLCIQMFIEIYGKCRSLGAAPPKPAQAAPAAPPAPAPGKPA
jgi:C4-dicarboxylate transporter, DctQ subunit